MHKVQQIAEQARASDPLPDEMWKTVPALFGFPVESDKNPVSRRPWATWSLSAAILMVSLWAFTDLRNAVERFGLIPAEFWRYGGLTTLTSFFLHAGVFHLLGNLYFLLIFGDNVEDYLGRWRYLLLILLATLAGDCLHAVAQLQSTTPCVGAFVLWTLWQLLLAMLQLGGSTNVAGLAHLGGAAVGVGVWLLRRKMNYKPAD